MTLNLCHLGPKVGVIGTGGIGQRVAEKLSGLVAEVVCYDKFPNREWIKNVGNGRYVDDVDELLAMADIISIHVPLLPQTRHLINEENIKKSVSLTLNFVVLVSNLTPFQDEGRGHHREHVQG